MGELWLSDLAGIVEDQRVEVAQALRQILELDTLEAAYHYVKQMRGNGAAKLPEDLTEAQIDALDRLGLYVVDADNVAQAEAETDIEEPQHAEDIFKLSMIALSATSGNPQEAIILLARLAELDVMPNEEIMAAATIIGRTF